MTKNTSRFLALGAALAIGGATLSTPALADHWHHGYHGYHHYYHPYGYGYGYGYGPVYGPGYYAAPPPVIYSPGLSVVVPLHIR